MMEDTPTLTLTPNLPAITCRPPAHDNPREALHKRHHEYCVKARAGLYDFIDDFDHIGEEALKAFSFVVGITSSCPGRGPLYCSGISVGEKTVVTTGYILRDSPAEPTIEISLPNEDNVKGCVVYFDDHKNVVIISGDFVGLQQPEITDNYLLGDPVTALGRTSTSEPRASNGKINLRADHYESDDLLSSSCSIPEWGIGGPLINSKGALIGMNLFSKKFSTPFIPTMVLFKCVHCYKKHGHVRKKWWTGLRIRHLDELHINDLESFYLKFRSTSGLFVRKVIEGSPAAKAGIQTGDVIASCPGVDLSSPVEFDFKLARYGLGMLRHGKKTVKVVIRRTSTGTEEIKYLTVERSFPPVMNQWPLLPPPIEENFDLDEVWTTQLSP